MFAKDRTLRGVPGAGRGDDTGLLAGDLLLHLPRVVSLTGEADLAEGVDTSWAIVGVLAIAIIGDLLDRL